MFDHAEGGVVEIALLGVSCFLCVEADLAQKRAAFLRADVAGDQLDELLLAFRLLGGLARDYASDRTKIHEEALCRFLDERGLERNRRHTRVPTEPDRSVCGTVPRPV